MYGYLFLSDEIQELLTVNDLRRLLNQLKGFFTKTLILVKEKLKFTFRDVEVVIGKPTFDGNPLMLLIPNATTDEFIKDATSHVTYNHIVYISLDDQFKINEHDLSTIYDLEKKFKTSIHSSVVVFDLDDTIIDEQGVVFAKDLLQGINILRSIYDYIGLWSHGSTNHVFKYVKQLCNEEKVKFDFVITRDHYTYNKSVIHVLNILNEKFNVESITYSCLVDDKFDNYNDDYSLFIHLVKKPVSFIEMAKVIELNTRKILYEKIQ